MMFCVANPNWLLSSLAQSAAALVAIIGGFLVSRVVTLASQQQGLAHRKREVDAEIDIAQSRLERLRTERRSEDRDSVRRWALDEVLEADGRVDDPEGLASKHWPRGSTLDEVIKWVDELAADVRTAIAKIESAMRLPRSDRLTIELLRARQFDIPEDQEGIYKSLLRRLRPQTSLGIHLPDISTTAMLAPANFQRYDELVRDEEVCAREVELLESQSSLLDVELAKVHRPSGLARGVGVLSYFALVGIVTPLIVMALQPDETSALVRTLLVVGFVSGLLALLWYLREAVKQLGNST